MMPAPSIPRHTAGKIDDFDLELVPARPEVLGPKLIDLLWHPGQRVFPARLLLIDGAPLVRAQLVRKAVHLHLGPAVAHRALDELDATLNGLFIRHTRRLRETLQKGLVLGLGLRELPRLLGCLLGLRQRKLLHVVAGAGQQLFEFCRHGPPLRRYRLAG